jgi:hypothetical protein
MEFGLEKHTSIIIYLESGKMYRKHSEDEIEMLDSVKAEDCLIITAVLK